MQRIVWTFDREHMGHPFIVLGATTLAEAGMHVTVMSSDAAAAGAPYHGNTAFGFETKKKNWERVNAAMHALKLREKEHRSEANRCEKKSHMDWDPGRKGHSRGAFRRKAWRHRALENWYGSRRLVVKVLGVAQRETVDEWFPYFRALWRMLRIDADVFIATRPEAAIYTAIAAKLRGKRFIYYPFELYGEQAGRASRFLAWLERMMLRYAVDAVITQNDMRAMVLEKERGARVKPLIVHNYKQVRQRAPTRRLHQQIPALAGKRIVLYEGYIMRGRWLDKLAQASAELPSDVAMVFVGPNKGKWIQANAAILEPLQAAGRIHILPPVPHEEVLEFCADADAGVIIYDDSVRNNYYCEPGKLTDYISVGVPVVAPNFPTIGPVVELHGIGFCFEGNTPSLIAQAIIRVLDRPRASWAPALAQACQALTWETQAPVLLAAVEATETSPSDIGETPARSTKALPPRTRQVA